mmetsp:Transcript_27500/g.49774  ORF Transcript_27500/g.49774 Transcript_27500/m.49774 type:complete len:970 (-) Transcript_27500:70-2979(-)
MPFRSASWLLHLACIAAVGQAGCQLSNRSYRKLITIQDTNFTGAFELDLNAGVSCIREVTTPWGAAFQSMHALADFYEQFYAFRTICRDPPNSSPQAEASPFNYGIFGSARGGSLDLEAAKVDLIGTLRTRADGLGKDRPVSIMDWYVPLNSLFNRLRDAHVNFRNGGTKVDAVLNSFIFCLKDDITKKAVTVKVAAQGPVMPDMEAVPSFSADGRRMTSIDGIEPMRWFQTNLLENSAFSYPFKSVGPRANHMLRLGSMGFAWLGSNIGDVSNLKPTVKVDFEDGSETTWSWTWLLVLKDLGRLSRCSLTNGTCYMEWMTGTLDTPGSLYETGKEAWELLLKPRVASPADSSEQASVLSNVLPQIPDEDMISMLRQEPGVRELLGIAEEQVPGSHAHIRSLTSKDLEPLGVELGAGPPPGDDEEPTFNTSLHRLASRIWMLNPEDSPATATYGFFEIKTDAKGHAYVLLKLTRFYLTEMEGAGFEYMQGFIDLWKKLVSVARQHGIKRLLVDVVGNSGGYVNYAYLFVRALFPELPFATICNEYDRPVGSLYESWHSVDPKQFLNVLNDSVAIRNRASVLTAERLDDLQAVTRALTSAGMSLDIFDDEQMELLSSVLDDLDMLTIAPEDLQDILVKLAAALKSFGNPFAQYLNAFTAKGTEFDPYKQIEVMTRGGVENVKFTAKYRVEDCALAFTQDMIDALDEVYHPFEEIIFLTDGLCGSSCDTALRTSYLISKRLKQKNWQRMKIPRIDFVTWGGLGGNAEQAKSTLSATSFPGGNVQSDAMYSVYNPVFLTAMFGYLLAKFAGAEKQMHQLDEFKYEVPQYPYYASKLPQYSQSALYQNMLGSDALPAEYLFFQTDVYLPEWYYGVRGMPQEWNESELDRMHQDAARAFRQEGIFLGASVMQATSQPSGPGEGQGFPGARVGAYALAGVAAVSLVMACAALYVARPRLQSHLPVCGEESSTSDE